MFWRFGGYANLSPLDSKLDKPDVTVEELLDDSDLIQELKQQNSKLIEFLREEPVLEKLLKYVTADESLAPKVSTPPDQDEDKSPSLMFFGKGKGRSRSKSVNKDAGSGETEESSKDAQRKKYAYVACEVLSSEVWSITEALLDSKEHLEHFWEYLNRPTPLDPVQAGYFTRVNETLLDKKTEEMVAFLKTLDGVVPRILQHVDCPMIMDLLLKMISLEKHEGGRGIVDWLQSQDLIPILLSYLAPQYSLSTQTAAGDFLKAIITISANATSQDQTVIGPNELTRQLVSETCVSQLIKDMLRGGNPLTVGVGIVIEVIRKNNSDYDQENQIGPDPRTSDPIYLGTLLRQFAGHIPDFMHLVRGPSATRPSLKAAFGEDIQPLGFDRFKTCELMAELLHCSNMGLLNEPGSEAEMSRRDQERARLKAEGKLTIQPASNASELDEPFASSVDSHGFHHAIAPVQDVGASPEKVEAQNASDEDGYEKVAVPETDALPDEVSFDDLAEKTNDSQSPDDQQDTTSHETTDDLTKQIEDLTISGGKQDPTEEGKPRVSSLTQQIQEQIRATEKDDETTAASHDVNVSDLPAEDKPAPLFASKASPSKDAPAEPATSDDDGEEPGNQSTATLQADTTGPPIDTAFELDLDGSPVVGDLLKMQFVDHQVVPTILDFFFRFPWNNFLHNVVYDVVQQVFNGTLERGYNRTLALNLFSYSSCDQLASRSDITERILEGQRKSDKSQEARRMRLGYMGHLTLIAEEVCKFAERNPPDLLGDQVMERVVREDWMQYVEGTLTETREKDNAVLGGVRPQEMGVRGGMGAGQGGLGQGGFVGGNGNSSALANAGIGGVPADSMALQDAGVSSYDINGGGAGLLSGFGDGEDDEEDEEESEAQRREKAVSDDEQTTTSPTSVAADNPGSSASIPPPLNLAPSRARLQLAARLAAKKKEASQALETDPDAADPTALETAALDLPSDEPLGSDVTTLNPDDGFAVEQDVPLSPGARATASRNSAFAVAAAGNSRVGGSGRFNRLFGTQQGRKYESTDSSDEDDDDDDDDSDEEHDDGISDEAGLLQDDEHRRRSGEDIIGAGNEDNTSAGPRPQSDSSNTVFDTGDTGLTLTSSPQQQPPELPRRRSNRERRRRPSTTEAKVRVPLDDDDADFGGGRDQTLTFEGDEGEGPVHDSSSPALSSDEEEVEGHGKDDGDDEDLGPFADPPVFVGGGHRAAAAAAHRRGGSSDEDSSDDEDEDEEEFMEIRHRRSAG